MFTSPLTIGLYQSTHYPLLRDLLERPDRSHVHIDWQDVLDWFHDPAVLGCLAWQQDQPVGVMAVSPPHQGISWLRVVALTGGVSVGSTVRRLWAGLQPAMRDAGVRRVAVLLHSAWLERALASIDFYHVDDVVSLKRTGLTLLRRVGTGSEHGLVLRPVKPADLPSILAVDHAAFVPGWRMHLPDFQMGMGEAVSFFLAEVGSEAVGYELTVPNGAAVHLARLATVPDMQGQGVGGSLLRAALKRCMTRGFHVMTVNTQASNLASQHLYRRFGFTNTSADVPVWEVRLD